MRRIRAIGAVTLLAAFGLAACSEVGDAHPARTSPSLRDVDGPWKEVIRATYAEAGSDAERAALEDGVISDQEYAYFRSRIISCLSALGISARFAPDKSLEYSASGDVDQTAVNNCNADNGLRAITLRDAIERNPQNRDENEIMTECLRRTKVVDAGYTAAMFARGVNFTVIAESPSFAKCAADPLQLRGER